MWPFSHKPQQSERATQLLAHVPAHRHPQRQRRTFSMSNDWVLVRRNRDDDHPGRRKCYQQVCLHHQLFRFARHGQYQRRRVDLDKRDCILATSPAARSMLKTVVFWPPILSPNCSLPARHGERLRDHSGPIAGTSSLATVTRAALCYLEAARYPRLRARPTRLFDPWRWRLHDIHNQSRHRNAGRSIDNSIPIRCASMQYFQFASRSCPSF